VAEPAAGEPPGRRTSMARATTTATIATFAAYGVTLLQQVLYARALGVGADTDALAAALAWAVATSGLIGVTLQSVVLPRYAAALHREPTSARVVLQSGSAIGLGAGLGIAVITFAAAPALANLLLPRSDVTVVRQLEVLLRLTAVLHVSWVAVWLATTIANARERYVLAALSPVAAAAPIIGVLVLAANPSVEEVAVAFAVGTILQVMVVGVLVGGRFVDAMPIPGRYATRRLLRPMGGIASAFLLMNGAGLMLRALASAQATGDVAVVDYAFRVSLAAEQLVLAGLLAVALTRWSQMGEGAETSASIGRVLPLVVDAAVLVAVLLMVVGTDAVGVLFGSVKFDASAVSAVGAVLAWMGPGIAAHMVLLVVMRAILATARTLVMVAIGVTVLLSATIVGVAAMPAGLNSVGLAYSCAWLCACVVGLAGMRNLIPPREVAVEGARAGLAGCVSAIVAWLALSQVPASGYLARLLLGGTVVALVAGASGALTHVALYREAWLAGANGWSRRRGRLK
jgi:peptidoglycan biosynthesis protein MviN/MurJ (putative lipid II flippase)